LARLVQQELALVSEDEDEDESVHVCHHAGPSLQTDQRQMDG